MSQYTQGNSYGGFLTTGSPFTNSPGDKDKKEILHSLRPLSIAQINKATQAHSDADWKVDDIEVGQVTVVAQIVGVSRQTTSLIFTIEDGTGRTEARHWVVENNSNSQDSKWYKYKEQTYVRVVGSLRSFGKKRYINANHMREVTDAHEIYYHILDTISATLMQDRAPPSGLGIQSTVGGPTTPKRNEATMSPYAAPQNASAARSQYNHLPPLQRAIVMFILDQPSSDKGVDVTTIATHVGAMAGDARKISNALEKLMDDGVVYTTIDESHFNVSI